MKFDVGDRVRTTANIEKAYRQGIREMLYRNVYLEDMCDKETEIICVTSSSNGQTFYNLEIDDGYNDWEEDLLEPVGKAKKQGKEAINHPEHYNQGKYEVIDEMRILFGDEAVKTFCRLNVYKYFRRAELKGKEEDKKKAEWYLDYLDSHGWQHE